MYRHDYAGTGYSPLSQINTENVASLREAWSYSLQGDPPASGPPGRGGAAGPNSQATPIVINGDDVPSDRERRCGARSGNGHRTLAPCRFGRGALAPRRCVLVGRRCNASHHLHGRSPADCARRQYGRALAAFGTNGEVDIVVPYNSVPLVYRNVIVVGANNPPGSGGACRQRTRVRCANRREALGIQLGRAAWQRRTRHMGGRQLERPIRRQRVAVLLHVGRATWAFVSASRVSDTRRLRWRSSGRQSLRKLCRGRGCSDRQVQMALSNDSS